MTIEDKAVIIIFFVSFLVALMDIADAIREIKND